MKLRLIALAAAAIGVILARRQSFKDDAERVKTAASGRAHKINDRVRPRSGNGAEDSDVVDVDALEAATVDPADTTSDTDIEKDTTVDAD